MNVFLKFWICDSFPFILTLQLGNQFCKSTKVSPLLNVVFSVIEVGLNLEIVKEPLLFLRKINGLVFKLVMSPDLRNVAVAFNMDGYGMGGE